MRAKTAEGSKVGKLQMGPMRLLPAAKAASSLSSSSSSAKLKKEFDAVLSPMSTYDISDKESDSESDYESDDDRSHGKKQLPSWAVKERLNAALETQFESQRVDPDELFGEVETCDLAAIFKGNMKERYKKRTSSGNWLCDRATDSEKRAYKREMQKLVSA